MGDGMGGVGDGISSLASQLPEGNKSFDQQPITCQEVQERKSQLKECLAQLEEAQARVAEALIRKGGVTEVVCREASTKYHQASG